MPYDDRKVTFDGGTSYATPQRGSGLTHWLIQRSGGLITTKKQAGRVLIMFIACACLGMVALFMFSDTPSVPVNPPSAL